MRRTTPLLALAVLAVAACDEVTAPPQTIIYELHTVVGDPLPYVISKDEKSEFRLMSMRYEFTGDQYGDVRPAGDRIGERHRCR